MISVPPHLSPVAMSLGQRGIYVLAHFSLNQIFRSGIRLLGVVPNATVDIVCPLPDSCTLSSHLPYRTHINPSLSSVAMSA